MSSPKKIIKKDEAIDLIKNHDVFLFDCDGVIL
jgi:hypothetical protein